MNTTELIQQTEKLITDLQSYVDRLKSIEAQAIVPGQESKPDHWKTDDQLKTP